MLYFDTAYLAKCYINEPNAARVRVLASSSAGLASCALARVEFYTTIQRHLREGNLTHADALNTLADFSQDEANGVITWLPLDTVLIEEACRRISALPATVYLRAADAIHLTCAATNGFQEIYSNDRHLLTAAQYFNLTGINVI